MSDTPQENRGRIVPGARVRVGGADSAGGVLGVVVDDYADQVGAGYDCARVRRWAVAADGTLAFVDDDGIEPARPEES